MLQYEAYHVIVTFVLLSLEPVSPLRSKNVIFRVFFS